MEDGEKAFFHLLRTAYVDADWTWDQTMRAIVTGSLYEASNMLAEKAAWQKVITSSYALFPVSCLLTSALHLIVHGWPEGQIAEEREARLARLRPAIRN